VRSKEFLSPTSRTSRALCRTYNTRHAACSGRNTSNVNTTAAPTFGRATFFLSPASLARLSLFVGSVGSVRAGNRFGTRLFVFVEPPFFERVVHHDQIADLRAPNLVPRADPGEVAESRLFRKRKRCIRLGFIRVEHDVRAPVPVRDAPRESHFPVRAAHFRVGAQHPEPRAEPAGGAHGGARRREVPRRRGVRSA
jgi:hypothetical protein